MTLSSGVVKSEIRTLYTIDMGGGAECLITSKSQGLSRPLSSGVVKSEIRILYSIGA